jgi:hypothetical protein
MPILFTFTFHKPDTNDYGRIQSFFEQFGWESVGSASYRYPPLGAKESSEDWFNKIIPALMLFRTHVLKKQKGKRTKLVAFTIDVQSSTGFNHSTASGVPLDGSSMGLKASNGPFNERKLRTWLTELENQYPYD